MAVSPARAVAFDTLLKVEKANAYASELLHSPLAAALSHADHGLATELVMGVLRWQSKLDSRIGLRSSQPLSKLDHEVLIALRLAAYQLAFLERVPPHAAVHESVELVKRAHKRSAAPFVNAVLRKLSKEETSRDFEREIIQATTAQRLSEASAHPQWLVERWAAEFGLDRTRSICNYDQHVPQAAIRLHGPGIEDEFKSEGIELAPGGLLTSARRVLSGFIPGSRAFREGRVTIQDEASQLVALLAGHGMNILDGCAAPGGKTRILAERNPAAKVLAVELHPQRAQLLRTRVAAANVQVIAADLRELPTTSSFDLVLADVPCSGTGTLARNPEIKWHLRAEDLSELRDRQLALLCAAMQHVQPGGRLVYSTCSLELEENSEVVGHALATDDSFSLLDCPSQLERLGTEGELSLQNPDSLVHGPFLRTIPGEHSCDGFFAAILQKAPARR